MQCDGRSISLSASDLANHLSCRHLTQLDRAVAEGQLPAPSWRDPGLALLQERGLAHEQNYVDHLRAGGVDVVELREIEGATAAERTLAAMADGVGAIVQAALRGGSWWGRADVLIRVPSPSELGDWSYEVVDTKLAQNTRGGTVLQLCLYTDLVARIQGCAPERMYVVKPGEGFSVEAFRFAEYQAYYRLVRSRLESTMSDSMGRLATHPYPCEHCDICRWWHECDSRRRQDDHLSLVAGIQSLHIAELERQGVHTLEQFAKAGQPLRERPERGHVEAFERAHGQARVQLQGRREGAPVYELLPVQDGLGLARLPAPSAGDLFFDIESDPFVEDGGIEYLLGVSFLGEGGELEYRAFWGLNRPAERRAFEDFIDFVFDRWRNFPDFNVYHFSPYEPGALKRLMSRHGTREAEVDRLLRGKRLIDLFSVTRQGLRASVESYSLKQLERFFGFERDTDLRSASAALRRVACALELGATEGASDSDLRVVEAYNLEDCVSTAKLRDWLEVLRPGLTESGVEIERPELLTGEASENIEERSAEVQEVFQSLVKGLPEDPTDWGAEEDARWLLAHQLEYFHREDRVSWWEFFRLHELDGEDLFEERKTVAGLQYVETVGGTTRCPVHRYRFPQQEVALKEGDSLEEVGGSPVGTVAGVDQGGQFLDIKKRGDSVEAHPYAVMVKDRVAPFPIDSSVIQLGEELANDLINVEGPYQASRDLLLKAPPRLQSAASGALRAEGESVLDAAVRLVLDLDGGVLPIQGPPGSGKTHVGARMIAALVREGKRVGVTAVSHKVIRNLLDKALSAAGEAAIDLSAVHKVSGTAGETTCGFREVKKNEEAAAALAGGSVVGGTAWLWSRDDMVEVADYLFVDEAGQMSLAQVLGASRASRNLVLLGDPQQLEQPQRGAHPEGSEVAALVHILDGRKTIADDAGLFLDETWRLHPKICVFTSELFYEGRLRSRAGLEQQALVGDTPFAGSGLFYVPVEHEGNQNQSLEEVERIGAIIDGLLAGGVRWTDADGESHPIQGADILVVAPYNAQVGALISRLPDPVRVGTVDKFQGQQAPVVIYSMASSSAEDAPRGMSFLYNPNRLNVATSRARCACIIVASPRVLEPECRSPEHMRWANALCRFRELATEVKT